MKFAYLIMAHHRFDVLKMLLSDLDYEGNDIFLHIDKKTKNVPFNDLRNCVQKSRLFFINRIPVYWGHYSQIRCVLNLLKAATEYSHYDYYHLLVGVEFPLMTQAKIHAFFKDNEGKEFIGFDLTRNYEERIKYFYFFWKHCRDCDTFGKRKLVSIGTRFLKLQKKLGVNRLKHSKEYYKKGYANWSITDKLARFFVEKSREIRRYYRWGFCADEVCFHTLVYHSEFLTNVYDFNDEYHSAMRITTWTAEHNQFHLEDVTMLMNCGKLFARKFDDDTATNTISRIIEMRE